VHRGDIDKAAKKLYGVGAETLDRMMADNRIEVPAEDDSPSRT
jgi:hypothetical protein